MALFDIVVENYKLVSAQYSFWYYEGAIIIQDICYIFVICYFKYF